MPFLQSLENSLSERCSLVRIGVISYNHSDRTAVTTAIHEFAPVCAVVGGMLAQDILKALGVREAPLANFFTFDGSTGAGNVVRMSMS
jgi:ubiquitin-like 1-activating enzyme E1 A